MFRKLAAASLMVSMCIGYAVLMGSIPFITNTANAQAVRTFNSPRRPFRLLAKQHNGNADVFPTADPSPEGTPLTLSRAMGVSGFDGSVTLLLGAGFTAPVTLTVYQWNQDNVNSSKSGWYRVAPAATGTNAYSQAVDSHYALVQFSIAEQTPWLVRASGSVTGDVYTESKAHPSNTGSTASGYTN